jgi:hypothetical protein
MKHKLTLMLIVLFWSSQSFSQSLVRYDSTGHPKAKGISLIVKYPNDLTPKEAERPNIVQKFTKDYPNYTFALMVQVNNLPPEAIKEVGNFTVADWKEVLESMGKTSNVYQTKLEFEKALIGDFQMTTERAGMTLSQKQRVISLIYNGKWIWLWCGVVGMPTETPSQVNQYFAQNEQKCFSFFNSLVLNQKYTKYN